METPLQSDGPDKPVDQHVDERRRSSMRRRRLWWAMLYGSFNPRRRAYRRIDRNEFQLMDWHHSRLLVVVIAILALCCSDAFLTLILLERGAREVNPVMASVVYSSASWFTIVKMWVTGLSVAIMVLLAGYRFMRMFRVEWLLYLVLSGYVCLVGYELWMLSLVQGPPIVGF